MRFGFKTIKSVAMKNLYFLPLIVLCIASCKLPKPYHQRINYIPINSPNFGVEMLTSDQLPTKPYFEVIDFDLVEKGKLSRREVMKKLEMEAIKEGVDAVMDVESWNASEEKVNLLTVLIDVMDEDGETTVINAPFTHIRGVGIKYLENINYIHDQPEFEYVYQIDPEADFPSPLFKIEYNLTGQEHMIYPESETAMEVYEKYFQFYSDFHLVYQRERWHYKSVDNKVNKRILYDENGYVTKTCMLKYDDKGRLVEVEVHNRLSGNDKVTYHYDEDGRKISRKVVTADQTTIFEQYNFDGERITGRRIRIIVPGEDNYHLNTSILYFDPDYLNDYYQQEYVKK